MKLYYSKGACSLAVRIVIHEMGLACEFEAVDLHTKITASGKNFLEINPKGAVPVLVISDSEVLTENAVIQQYLADKNHATQLLPAMNDLNRYHVLEWLNFISTDLHKAFGSLFDPTFPEELKDTKVKPLIKKRLVYVNSALERKNYLMGEQFTLPDAYLFVILLWTFHFKIDIKDLSYLNNYFHELKKRKSIMQVLKEEGLS